MNISTVHTSPSRGSLLVGLFEQPPARHGARNGGEASASGPFGGCKHIRTRHTFLACARSTLSLAARSSASIADACCSRANIDVRDRARLEKKLCTPRSSRPRLRTLAAAERTQILERRGRAFRELCAQHRECRGAEAAAAARGQGSRLGGNLPQGLASRAVRPPTRAHSSLCQRWSAHQR